MQKQIKKTLHRKYYFKSKQKGSNIRSTSFSYVYLLKFTISYFNIHTFIFGGIFSLNIRYEKKQYFATPLMNIWNLGKSKKYSKY